MLSLLCLSQEIMIFLLFNPKTQPMKKIILIAAVLFSTASVVNAQVAKGNIMLGGSLGFNSGKTTRTATNPSVVTITNPETKTSNWDFSPQVGYFFTDRLAAGISLSAGGLKTTQTVFDPNPSPGTTFTTESKESYFGAGVFARYYAPVNESFYFWGQLNVGFASGKGEITGPDPLNPSANITTQDYEVSGMNVGIMPGFSFFPSTRYSLDFSIGNLGIMNTKVTNLPGGTGETVVKSSDFGLNIDMTTLRIGTNIYF